MAILRNNTDRRQIFELPHDLVCTEDECLCMVREIGGRTLNPETGEAGTRSDEVRLPYSVHLPARGASKVLPDNVVNVPQVAAAISRGLLSVA